jgi:hypothetical protein
MHLDGFVKEKLRIGVIIGMFNTSFPGRENPQVESDPCYWRPHSLGLELTVNTLTLRVISP